MHLTTDLATILPTLPRLSMKSHAYRVIDYRYLAADPPLHPNRFLYGLGAPYSGARFTPKSGPPMIYMAEELATAFDEANPEQAILRAINPGLVAPTPPGGHVSIEYDLEFVLDVTDTNIQSALGTTQTELRRPWRQAQKRGLLSETQRLGHIVYESGCYQGIWYESARNPGAFCLAVFVDRLTPPSYLEVYDPHNNIRERLP